jgi:gliding motility-associated-like protein
VTVNPALAISGTLTATVGGTEPVLLINGNTTAAASSWSSSDLNVATIDATTSGKIVAVGAGTTTITYTDPATSCQATATFTVSAAPLISGPNNQISNFDLCDGESIALSATGTPATASAWTTSNSSVVSVNASTGEITAEGAGTATITFNEINGSSSSIAVNVYSIPITPAIAYNDGTTTLKTICVGGQATILVQGSSPALNYEWEYSSVAAFTNASSIVAGNVNGTFIDINTPGYYRVRSQNTTSDCYSSYSNIIELDNYSLSSTPTISFVGTYSGQSTAITCDASSITLQGTRTNGITNTLFVWERYNDAQSTWDTVSQSTNTDISVTTSGRYRISETMATCSSSSPYSTELVVNDITTTALTLSSSTNGEFCDGQTLIFNTVGTGSFNASPLSPATGFNRTWWYVPSGSNSAIQINTTSGLLLDATKDGAKIYVKDTYGTSSCSSISSLTANTITVNPVPSDPIIEFTDGTNGTTTICAGSSLVLQTSSSTTITGMTLSWEYSTNNTFTPSSVPSNLAASPATGEIEVSAAGYYRQKLSNSTTGCESGYSNTLEISTFDLGGPTAQAPTLAINGQTGLNTTVCSGSNVTLNASAQNGLQNSYFVWERRDDVSSAWVALSGQSGSTYTTNIAGQYRVSEANASCSSTSPVSSTITITVVTPPVLSISSNSGSNTFCEGETLNISSSPSYSANQAVQTGFTRSWWYIPNGSSTPVQIPATGLTLDYATHDGANIYIQDDHQLASCASNSSTTAITLSINQQPSTPVLQFDDGTNGSKSICSGSQATIEIIGGASLSNQTFTWEYDSDPAWTNPQAVTDLNTSPVDYSKDVDGEGYYRVKTTDVNGCVSNGYSNVLSLSTYDLPQPTIASVDPNSTVCDEDDIVLSVSSTYTGTAVLTHRWYKEVNGSNVELGTSTVSTFTLTPSNVNYGSGDYLIRSELAGCTSSPISAATTISVISPTELIVSTSTPNLEVCSGYNLTSSDLNVLPLAIPTGYSRTWYYQEPGSSNWTTFTPSTGISLTNSTTSNVTYSIKAEDEHDLEGCTEASNNIIVTVFPVPVAPTIAFDNSSLSQVTICSSSSEAVTATSSTVGSPTFKWYFSTDNSTYSSTAAQVVGLNAQTNTAAVAIGTSTYSGSTLITDGQGYYKASVIDANGCESLLSSSLQVIHEDLPKPTLSVNDNIVCDGSSIVLSASSSHSLTSSFTYNWFKGNSTTPFASTSSSTYTIASTSTDYISGNFSVSTSLSGCTTSENSDDVSVNIITPATLTVIPVNGTANYCEGQVLSFTGTGTDFTVSELNTPTAVGSNRSWWYILSGSTTPVQINASTGLTLNATHDGAVIYVRDDYTGVTCSATSPTIGSQALTLNVDNAPNTPSITFATTSATSLSSTCASEGIEIEIGTTLSSENYLLYYLAPSQYPYGSPSLVSSPSLNSDNTGFIVYSEGKYFVKAQNINTSCESQLSSPLEVVEVALPTPTIALAIPNSTTIQYVCPSTWDPLRISGADTSGLYDIIWEVRSLGSGTWTQLTASDNKGHHQPTLSGYYRATIYDGTSGTCFNRSLEVRVETVNLSAPVIAMPTYSVCDAADIILSVSNYKSGATYTWTNDDPDINSITANSNSASPNSKTISGASSTHDVIFEVSVTYNGCTVAAASTQTVTINGLPSAPTIVGESGAGTGHEICSGSTMELSVNNPISGVTYNWYRLNKSSSQTNITSNSGNYVGSGTTFNAGTLSNGGYNYYAEAVSSSGCGSNLSTYFQVNDLYLSIVQLKWNAVSGSIAYICGDQGNTFDLEITNYTDYPGATSFVLFDDQGNGIDTISPSSAIGAVFNVASAGTYKVKALKNNCLSSSYSSTYEIRTVSMPKAILSASSTEVCENSGGVTISLTNSGNYAFSNHTWYDAVDISFLGYASGVNQTAISVPSFTASNMVWQSGETFRDIEYIVEVMSEYSPTCKTGDTISVRVLKSPDAPIIENEYNTQSDVEICGGSSHDLSVTSPQTGFSYQWYSNTSPVSSPTQIYTATSSSVYSVKAEDASGCISTASNAITVDFVNLSAPTISVNATGSTSGGWLCDGGVVTLNVTPVSPKLGQSFELWNTGVGADPDYSVLVYDPASTAPLQFVITESGNYSVKTIQGDCESVSTSNNIAINELAVPNLNISGSTIVCEGSTTSLSVPYSSNWNYAWIRTDNSNDTISVTRFLNNYTPINDGFYKVYAYTNLVAGCEYENTSGLIQVKSLPAKPILNDYSDTICQGSQSISFQISNFSNSYFKWYREGVYIEDATNNYRTIEDGGNWTVSAVNTAGCEGPQSDVIVVFEEVVPTPVATPQYAQWSGPTDTVFSCVGNEIDIAIGDTSYGTTYSVYRWNLSGGSNGYFNTGTYYYTQTNPISQFIAGDNISPEVVITGGTGIYRIRATKPGCNEKWSNYIIVEDNIQVPTPLLTEDMAYAGINSICQGDSVIYVTGTSPAYGYPSMPTDVTIEWYKISDPENVLGTAQTFKATDAGTYKVRFLKQGCKISSQTSKSLNVNQKPQKPALNYQGDNALYANQYVTLTATPALASYDYRWFVNSVPGQWTSNNYDTTISSVGDYAVIIRDALGCISDTSSAAEFTSRSLLNPQMIVRPIDTILAAQGIPVSQNSAISICNNGSFDLEVVGPEFGKRYTLWEIPTINMPSQKAYDDNGDIYQFVYDGTTNKFLGVSAGKYYSEVDDASVSGSAVQSDTIDITGVNISKPQILPSGTTLCENDEGAVTLNVTASSSDPAGVSYTWYYGKSGTLADSIFAANTLSQTSIGAGIYRVSKNLDGCTKYSEPITVTAYPKPETPQIAFANDTVCEGAIWPVSISNVQADREYSYIVNGIATGWTPNTNININSVGSWQTASAPTMLPTKQLLVVARNTTTGCVGDTMEVQVFTLTSLVAPSLGVDNGISVNESGVETYEVCIDESFALYVPNAIEGLTYTLFKDVNLAGYDTVDNPLSGDPYSIVADGVNDVKFINLMVDNNSTTYDDFKVEVSDPDNGCTVKYSNILRVKEKQLLAPVASVASGFTNTICAGDSTLLEIPSLGVGQTVEWYYVVSNTETATLDEDNNTSHYAKHGGTYYARIIEDDCQVSSNGIIITETQQPAAPVINNSSIVSLCSGASITLTDQNNTIGQYIWYRDGAEINGASYTSNSITTNTAGVYRAKRLVNGCWSELSTSVELKYQPLLTPIIRPLEAQFGWTGYAPNSEWVGKRWTELCPGDEATIILTNEFETDVVYTLQEEAVPGTWQDLPGKSFTYTPTLLESETRFSNMGPGRYRVKSSKPSQGCDPAYSDELEIIRNTIIEPIVTPSPTAELCDGDRITLSVSNWTNVAGSLQSGTVNYQWWKTGQIDPVNTTQTGGNGSIQVDVAGQYYVVANYGEGCRDTSTNKVTVTVAPLPSEPLLADQSPYKKCEDATIDVEISPIEPGVDYYWYDMNNGSLLYQTGPNNSSTVPFQNAGEYGIVAKNIGGCTSDTAKFTIQDILVQEPSILPAALDLCPGESDTLRIAYPIEGYNYVWYSVGQGILDTTRSLAVSTPGTYYAKAYYSELNGDDEEVICLSDASPSVIVVPLNAPNTPVVTNPFICEDDWDHDLADYIDNNAGVKVHWYTAPSRYPDESFLDATSTVLFPMTGDKDSLWVAYENLTTGCYSPYAKMVVNEVELPPMPVVDSAIICNGAGPFNINDIATYDDQNYTMIKYGMDSLALPANYFVNFTTVTTATTDSFYYALRNKVPVGGATCESQWALGWIETLPEPAAPIGGTLEYCEGDATNDFDARVLGLNPGTTLRWYDLNSNLWNGTGELPVISSDKDTNYYFFITNTNGYCESTAKLIHVKINPRPARNIFTVDTIYACRQDSIELAPYVNSTYSPLKLKWWDSPTSTDYAWNPNKKVYGSITGARLFTVSKVNTNTGCESTRDSIWVVINSNETAPVVAVPDLTRICANTFAGTLDTFITYDDSQFTLYWYNSFNSTSATTVKPFYDSYSTLTPDSISYWVSLIDQNGCESPRRELIVTQPPTPAAPIVRDTAYCLGAEIVPLTQMVNPGQYAGLNWYDDPLSEPQAFIDISNLQSDTYFWVSATSIDGCEGPLSKITIQVTPLSTVNITASNTVIPAASVNGAAGMVSISAAGADIYEFFDPDGYDPDNPTLGILGSTNPITVTPSVSGYYTVKGTDTATGCVGIDSIYIHINPFDPGAIGFNYTATGAPVTGGTAASTTSLLQEICYGQHPTDINNLGYPSGGSGNYIFKWKILSPAIIDPATQRFINGDTILNIDDSVLVFSDTLLPNSYYESDFQILRYVYDQGGFAISDTVKIQVLDVPQIAVSEINNSFKIPTGHPLTFTIQSGVVSGYSLDYKWRINSQQQGITSDTIKNIFLSSGTNWIEGRAYRSDQFGNLKCYSNDSLLVKVYDLVPGVISSSQMICYGGKAQDLTGTQPEGGDSLYRYVWEYLNLDVSPPQWDTLKDLSGNAYMQPVLPFDPNEPFIESISLRRMVYSLTVGVSSNSVDITVLAPAPPPTVNLPQVCFGNYVGPLSATPINGYAIEWYDQNNLTSLRLTPPIPDSSAGPWYVSQVDTITGCRSPLSKVEFEWVAEPNPPLTKPAFVCKTDPSGFDLLANVDTNTLFRVNWYDTDTLTPLALSPKVAWNGLNDTVYFFVSYTDTSTGCTGSKSVIPVYYLDGPQYDIVSSDADGILCFGQDISVSLQFTSSTGVIDSLTWFTDIPGYPSLTGMSNLISPDSTIKYNIFVEDTNGCANLDFLWLTVIEPLDTPASLIIDYCQFETSYPVSSGLATGTSALGEVTWYTGQARTAALPTAPTPNTNEVDTLVYYYTETDTVTGCTTVYGDVETRIFPLPMSPITAPVEVCANDTTPVAPYAQTTITDGILNWYQADSLTSIVGTPLTSGSTLSQSTYYTVRQKDTVTGCFSEISQALVEWHAIPDATIISTDSLYKICRGDQVSLALTSPQSFLSATWNVEYTKPDGTKEYVPNLWSGVTFTHSPDTTTLYIVEAMTIDSCLVKYTQLVTVQPLPKKPAIRDYVYCQFEGAYPIVADSLSSTNKLLWHQANGQIDTVSILPAPSTQSAGILYRYVQQYDPVTECVSEMDTAVITINALPTKPTTQERELCEDWGGISWPIADTTLGIYGSLSWYELDSVTAIDSLPLINGQSLAQSTGYLVKQQDLRTGCFSEFALAPVTLLLKPDAKIISTDTLFKTCSGESITLGLSQSQEFSTIRWRVDRIGSPIVYNQGTGATFTHTPLSSTIYTAYVVTYDGCDYEYQQLVTVQPLPSRPAILDYEYCQFEDAYPITADSLSSGNKLLWHKANGVIDTLTSLPAPSTQTAGISFRYVQQYDPITGCSSPMDTARITVNGLPSSPTTQAIEVCEENTSQVSPVASHTLGFDALSQPFGILHWFLSDSATALNNIPVVSGATITDTITYLVKQEDTRNGCFSDYSVAQVYFLSKPAAEISTLNNQFNICAGEQISLVLSNAQKFSSIVWDIRSTAPSGLPFLIQTQGTGASFVHRPDTTSLYIARATTIDGCEYSYEQMVSVQSLPEKPMIRDYEYCQYEDPTVITASALENNNVLLWYRDNGSTDTLTVLPAPSTDSVGTFYRYVQQYDLVTGCASEFDTAVIVIRSLPLAPVAKTYFICKSSPEDTLSVNRGPYSASYLSNLNVEWFDANDNSLDTIPAISTSDTGTSVYYVRHVNKFTGCTSPKIQLSAEVYQVQVDTIITSDATCYDYSDGVLSVLATGPYPVTWNYILGDSVTSPSYQSGSSLGIGAGSYEVVAQDSASCSSVRYNQNRFFSINQLDPIRITQILASRPSCHDTNDASIEIMATGRDELLYSIDNGGNLQTSNLFEGLSPYTQSSTSSNQVRRIYDIQVTDSIGCPVYQRTSQPDSSASKSVVVGITTNNGSQSVGGYDPLLGEGVAISTNYSGSNSLFWSPNGNLKITENASWLTLTVPYNSIQNTEVSYSKKLTGSSEMVLTRYIAIQLSELNGSDTIVKVIATEDVLNVNGTSATSSSLPTGINGGQAVVNYNISDEGIDPGLYKIDIASYHRAKLTTTTINDTVSVQAFTGSTFAGTMDVELFEGPKSSFRLETTLPTTMTTAGVHNDISCWGSENGRIDISWSSTNDVYVSVDSGATYTSDSTGFGYLLYDGLDSGSYYVTLRDENNCYVYYDEIRSYELRSPGPIVLDSILVTPNSCYDPEVNGVENDDAVIQMFAHGGIIPDNDDIAYVAPQLVYSVDGGQLGSWSTQNTFASLDTGWYHLKVSNLKNTLQDPMGCVNEYMISPYHYIDQPDSLRLDSLYYIPVQCYDSTDAFVEFYASGGNNISYSLDTLNYQTGSLFENIAPAEYFPTIEDDKNCPAYYYHKAQKTYLDIRDSIEIEEPSPMFINFVTTDLLCNEVFDSSSIEVVIIGGNIDPNTSYDPSNPATYRDSLQGFVYEWSFDSTSAVQGQYGYFIDTLSWNVADSLWAGTYNLSVEDYKGCFVESSVTLNQPDSIRLDSVYTSPVSCWDSSNAILEIYATGGNGLEYTIDSIPNSTLNATWGLVTSYDTLSQGDTSFIYVKDTIDPSCFVDYKAPQFYYVDSLITFTVDTAIVTPVLCFGDTTGTILVQTSGGLNPLFNFDTLSTTLDTIGFISVPSDSVYITVTDINGCTPKDTLAYTSISRKLFVPQPDPLVVLAATDSNVYCAEDTTGIISAFVAGGTTPYDILWTSGDTTLADSSVSAGLYYIEVIDTNGCYAWDSTSVFAIDSDCDLITDSIETYADYDLDGLPNAYDLDSDNDGLPDSLEYDYNRDGIPLDDCDGDGWPNYLDPDMCEFYIPSVITPNSDGDNDALFIPGLQYFNNFKFTVFNSMGNKVYQVENTNINFNGSTSGTVVWSTNGSLPSGTYYYVLEIRPNKWTQTGYIFLAR